MLIEPSPIEDVLQITLSRHEDERGYFMRSFDEAVFRAHGLVTHWVQENESFSMQRGVVRGLHFQRRPATETKLVRVVSGRTLDVFLDLRESSPSFGRWGAVELSAERRNMVYIPKGFAHGYCTLTERVVMLYKMDAPYTPELQGGVRWNDPALGIPWPVTDAILSPKDAALPLLEDLESLF